MVRSKLRVFPHFKLQNATFGPEIAFLWSIRTLLTLKNEGILRSKEVKKWILEIFSATRPLFDFILMEHKVYDVCVHILRQRIIFELF